MMKRQIIVYIVAGALALSSSVALGQKKGKDKRKTKTELTEEKRLEFDFAFHEGEKALVLGEYESYFLVCNLH